MITITRYGRSLERPDAEAAYWRAAGWTVTGSTAPAPLPVALIDDSTNLDSTDPSSAAAWSSANTRAAIFALLGTGSFRQSVDDRVAFGGGGGGGGGGLAQDTDGVYYPSPTGTGSIAQDTDGVYYPTGL